MTEQITQAVKLALSECFDPLTETNLAASNTLKSIQVSDNSVQVTLVRGYPVEPVLSELTQLVYSALQGLDFQQRDLEVIVEQNIVSHAAQQGVQAVEGVKNIIAIASGKGGVGKSTVAANLGLALARAGANVALLDADIYGPSQPRMLGVSGKPKTLENKMLIPMINHNLKIMSIGFMVEEDTPMIWRGPMVTQALEQMLRGCSWNYDGQEVDYLIIDLPPGTGDIQLTLSQKVPVTGAVIVTTPQDIALLDARKAFKMFEKVEVPVFGIIENMSTHVCSQCGHEEAIFGKHGAAKMAQEYRLQVLGEIPLDASIRENADSGKPSVIADPEGAIASNYINIAMQVAAQVANKKKNFSTRFPNIVVESS